MLTRAVAVVMAHGGFVATSRSALDILTDLTEKFIGRIGEGLSLHRSDKSEDVPMRNKATVSTTKTEAASRQNESITRDHVVRVARQVTAGGFRGGFPELVAYKEQELAVTSALREAESRVKRKITDWQKILQIAESRPPRLANYQGDLSELERIFGLFPDNVRIPLTDDIPIHIPRTLAQKVIAAGWPTEQILPHPSQ